MVGAGCPTQGGHMRRVVFVLLVCGACVATGAPAVAQPPDIGRNPVTLQLRYLQTLGDISVNQNSTVVFPMDVLTAVQGKVGETNGAARTGR